jgi:osmotically-inducible protein OsmY
VKSDSQLRQHVQEELGWEPSVDERQIGVAVSDAVVTLTGEVGSLAEKWNAERAVERVSGVRGVANDVEVRLAGEHNDPEIAGAAADALRWNTLVPSDRITPAVENGWIRLTGDVDHEYERRAAERAVRYLSGVRGVSNLITVKAVKPRAKPKDIKADIQRTFQRQAALDANQVSVEVSGDVVTLRGQVRSWAERRDAERAAWAAPGVSNVRNNITTGGAV